MRVENNIYMSSNDSKSTHIIVRIIAYSLEMPSEQTGLCDPSSQQKKKTNKIIKIKTENESFELQETQPTYTIQLKMYNFMRKFESERKRRKRFKYEKFTTRRMR